MARPDIWIGTIEISWSDEKTPTVFRPAFTVVTTWATSPEEFREKCVPMFESYGWKLGENKNESQRDYLRYFLFVSGHVKPSMAT